MKLAQRLATVMRGYAKDAVIAYIDKIPKELEYKKKEKLKFYTRQFVDAMSPSNFVATNPEVIRQAIDKNKGNWAAAARDLNMHRSNLHNLAKRLGLK